MPKTVKQNTRLGGGAPDHGGTAAIRPPGRRRLSAGRVRDRQSAARVLGRYWHAVVDHRCAGAGRQPSSATTASRRRSTAQARRSGGLHRRLRGACGRARQIRAPAGKRRRHVLARPFRPHRDRERRGHGGEMSRASYATTCRSLRLMPGAAGIQIARASLRSPSLPRVPASRGPADASCHVALRCRGVLCAARSAGVGVVDRRARSGAARRGRSNFRPACVDRDGRLLRAYATPEGRWRLPATRAGCRSALFRDAVRLRGQALPHPSRRRSAGARARGVPARQQRAHRLGRLDADHAGGAAAGAAHRAQLRCQSSARSCARSRSSAC